MMVWRFPEILVGAGLLPLGTPWFGVGLVLLGFGFSRLLLTDGGRR
ncbi:hypothetical protein [Thermus scotoductus]|nr:hypothetical protein [Thermus scotoductus]